MGGFFLLPGIDMTTIANCREGVMPPSHVKADRDAKQRINRLESRG